MAGLSSPPGRHPALWDELPERLLRTAREVSFPAGARVMVQGGTAEWFWLMRSGAVALDHRDPRGTTRVIETVGPGDLLGLSWLFPPHVWRTGAISVTAGHALEFDASAVRAMCAADPELGQAFVAQVADTIGRRLMGTRIRLLDVYGPPGGGGAP
ncbi:cyclic nucleotide-binding domain-containing protein [Streptomyces sp. NPDC018031]|uniref:cyclic nucleotide-binding domain-containing protein n=1 Tax=Streptomyces sp. NPDC018031 TaxID=3365033 RepID=UPI00378991FB